MFKKFILLLEKWNECLEKMIKRDKEEKVMMMKTMTTRRKEKTPVSAKLI